jgi:predicted metal-dependent phosphoesterase TrpH
VSFLPGDLHTHTTFSDGSVRIEKLPVLAARAGLSWLAVSDHDSLKSVEYALEHPQQDGVNLIPATELSAFDPASQRRVHLLAYWPEICPALRAHCEGMTARRNAACLQSAKELEAIYPQFKTEMALEYARDSGVLFKSGIMQALGELGLSDAIYGEVYHKLFGTSPRGLVLHKPGYDTVDTVLDTLKKSCAVVVFAHPSVYQSMELVRTLAAQGRIDGIEIDHPRNTEQDKEECRALCQKYHLIETGGTDFHGSNSGHPHPIGTGITADDQIERIYALAQQRRKKTT